MLGVDAPHAVLDATVSDCVREEAVRRKADLIILGRGRAQGTFRILSHVYPVVRESPARFSAFKTGRSQSVRLNN